MRIFKHFCVLLIVSGFVFATLAQKKSAKLFVPEYFLLGTSPHCLGDSLKTNASQKLPRLLSFEIDVQGEVTSVTATYDPAVEFLEAERALSDLLGKPKRHELTRNFVAFRLTNRSDMAWRVTRAENGQVEVTANKTDQPKDKK